MTLKTEATQESKRQNDALKSQNVKQNLAEEHKVSPARP